MERRMKRKTNLPRVIVGAKNCFEFSLLKATNFSFRQDKFKIAQPVFI